MYRWELGNLQVLQKYEKLLFRKFVRTSTQVVTKLNGTEGERCKNPLFTIFFANQRMQESLAEVSKNRSISIGKWLMFMESKTNLDNFFQNINVPFNCEFLVAQQANDTIITISEVYHLSESTPLQQNIVATWNNNEGLIWNSKHLFEHRGDLMGIQLTAAVVTSGREPIITKDNRRKPTVLAGYTGNVWKVIEQAVNARHLAHGAQIRGGLHPTTRVSFIVRDLAVRLWTLLSTR
ncbi:hypothetical protein C0J52_08369 [Blattella germanica]|nr:hypothetical protein C0J52_08369 [Blattella germanica]